MILEINLRSCKRDEMIDITSQVQSIIAQEAVHEGLAVVYAAHTTAGITINENADPDVTKDSLRRLDEVFPWDMAADRNLQGYDGEGIGGPLPDGFAGEDADLCHPLWQCDGFTGFGHPPRNIQQ